MDPKELEKHIFKGDIQAERKKALEACLQRACLQLLDMVNDTLSVVYNCIEAKIEVGNSDQIVYEAEQLIIKACKEVGLDTNDMNSHRHEYFDDGNTEEIHISKRMK